MLLLYICLCSFVLPSNLLSFAFLNGCRRLDVHLTEQKSKSQSESYLYTNYRVDALLNRRLRPFQRQHSRKINNLYQGFFCINIVPVGLIKHMANTNIKILYKRIK